MIDLNNRALIKKLGFQEAEIEFTAQHILPDLVGESLKRIVFSPFGFDGLFCGHSGGKDSVLVRWLLDEALKADSVPVKEVLTVHTPKPAGIRNEVHPLTKEFLYSMGRPILYFPDGGDFKALGLTTQIDGTRMAEAERRDGKDVGVVVRGKEWSRKDMPLYLDEGLFGLQFVYPIFDWTDLQVWTAIFHNNIPFSPEYYHDFD